ncbi:balbiani ring protein 3-like isoform X2 [Anneissia japonica]|uniref:balbiani ring protein 3-like isoform X2 n=1 Tax=Anneissia japonica TaxID=1529436 RepID=UPI0014258EC0|nr:balbiani ring protein 3-like isoform X2 [Anneissia japonica]
MQERKQIEETIPSLNDKKKEIENQTSLDEYLQEFFPNQNRSEVVSNIAQTRPSFQRRSGRHKENMFAKVDREAQRVKCGKPREILVDSYTELGFAKGFGTKLFPSCIVVDRCKNSGCCQESEECRASRTMNVTREFLNNGELITRTVAKDFECECRKKPAFCPETNTTCPAGKQWSDSACKCVCKKCPSLFIIDEDRCTCDCLVSNRLCKNHAKGKRSISTEDCNCIKSGLCNPPQCINGHYDADLCKCVQDHVER